VYYYDQVFTFFFFAKMAEHFSFGLNQANKKKNLFFSV